MSDGRRYRIEGVLGQGGFGTVYKAQLLGEGGFTRAVALKVLNADMEGMEDVARRLRDEARLLGLLRHRAILHVDGLVRMNGRWTVVMEYIDGSDLQRVARGGGVPLGPALEIIGEVASALHVAYTTTAPSGVPLKLLHRDIKPPNILLTSAGEVKVLDFGIARAEFGNREAQTRSVLYGSVGYMAPERLDFEELPEGDVYALGTVLYEILVGAPLGKASIREEKHQARIEEALDLLERKMGPLPPDFPELLGSMLSYDPEERPSAREVERRCRSIRQQIHGPWLRDWAEKAVPPLQQSRDQLPGGDFSGSVVSESGGVSLLQEDESAPVLQKANATVPVSNEPAVAPEPPRPTPRQRTRRRGGAGAMLTGLGLIGCLGVGAVGIVVLFLGLLVIAASSTTDTIDYETGVYDPPDPTNPPVEKPPPVSTQGWQKHYGPPNGPHMRFSMKAPWEGKKLPVEPGAVTYSDETTLLVTYGGDQLQPVARVWHEALVREFGYESEYDFESDDVYSATLRKGGKQLIMSVSKSQGNVIVSMVFTE